MKQLEHRERFRKWAGNLLLLGLSTLAALLFGEALVRVVAPQQLIVLRSDIWIPDETGLGWRVAPDLDTEINTGERTIRLNTDENGYRIGAESGSGSAPYSVEGSAAPMRVLALGDSFLAAIQVDNEDTVTARLSRELSDELERPVTVVNSGVSGWEINRYLLLARAELDQRQVDLVAVFLFLGNDIVEDERTSFPPRTGHVIHSLRWPRSLQRAEIVQSILYPLNDTLERRSHLFILARKAGWQVLMNLGLSARRFPVVELRSEAGSTRWNVTGRFCEELASTAAAHGVETFFVLVPGSYHVDPELGVVYAQAIGLDPEEFDLTQSSRLMSAELDRRGLRFVDASAPFIQAHRDGILTHGEVDTHLTPEGHAVLADVVRQPILDLLRARISESGSGET